MFEAVSEPGSDADSPLLRLQALMRDDEARLASAVADSSDCVVLCDGPIGFLDLKRSPVVGVIKRFARLYLDPEREQLLARLEPGQRTPLFDIADVAGRTRLYAWYLRLAPLRSAWHDHAGLVRCELTAAVGIREASRLADQVTALLPGYSGRPSDPRAPQNLAPVGGLETWLLADRAALPRGCFQERQDGWITGQVDPGADLDLAGGQRGAHRVGSHGHL